MFLKYKLEVENQLYRKIKCLRTDWGGEYETNSLNTFCEKIDIIYEVSACNAPIVNV